MGRIDLVTRFLISMVAPLSRRSPKPCAKSLVKPGVLSQAILVVCWSSHWPASAAKRKR